MDINEPTLGIRFACGGEIELEEVIQEYGVKLLRYATSILCSHHDAEDVMQQIFLSAYQSRRNFDGRNLSAWLYKIAYNACINHLKKRRRIFWGSLFDIRDEAINPFDEPDSDILGALNRLKISDRALVFGRVVNEQSYEELSQILGKSSGVLRKQFLRAKKKLHKLMCNENEFERGKKNECKQT